MRTRMTRMTCMTVESMPVFRMDVQCTENHPSYNGDDDTRRARPLVRPALINHAMITNYIINLKLIIIANPQGGNCVFQRL